MATRIKNYPVLFFGLVQSFWLSLLILANAFGWWTWSADQQAAVNGLWIAATALATWLLTGKTPLSVTPVSNPHDNEGNPLTP